MYTTLTFPGIHLRITVPFRTSSTYYFEAETEIDLYQ